MVGMTWFSISSTMPHTLSQTSTITVGNNQAIKYLNLILIDSKRSPYGTCPYSRISRSLFATIIDLVVANFVNERSSTDLPPQYDTQYVNAIYSHDESNGCQAGYLFFRDGEVIRVLDKLN
jgi:hypothetical protein